LEKENKNYIAHVKNGTHFVLVTSINIFTNEVYVLDPYFNTTTYNYDSISGALVYTMKHREIPVQYPTYKQCDAAWGNDIMVNTTLCKVGCLMSSMYIFDF
jgi:DNA-binding beta-propeller fold protein YncE